MKTYAVIILLLAILLDNITLTAQEEDIPFPPDPADIFAEGVEVLEMEIVEPNASQSDTRPLVDNPARVVRVYDPSAETWREIPFPDAIPDDAVPYFQRQGETLLLIVRDLAVWQVDETNFTLTRHELVCDNRVPAIGEAGTWGYIDDSESGVIALCFTESGEITDPLPTEISWYRTSPSPSVLPQSPDGEWLILLGVISVSDRRVDYAYYSYEIASGDLLFLGRIESEEGESYPPNVGEWVSDTSGLIAYNNPPEFTAGNYYAFDATQAESLALFVRGWLGWTNFDSEVRQYDFMRTTAFLEWKWGTVLPEHENCELSVYNPQGILHVDLGYDCVGSRALHAGTDFFSVLVASNPSQTSSLVHIDGVTGEITELFTDEIEGLLDVSPNGRYIALLMDDSRQVDRVDYFPPARIDDVELLQGLTNPFVVIWDMDAEQIAYEVDQLGDTTNIYSNVDVYTQACGIDCVIVTIDSRGSLNRLILYPSGEIEPLTTYSLIPSPNNQQFIIEDEGIITVVDFVSGTRIPLTTQNASNYVLQFEWLDETTITVTVRPRPYDDEVDSTVRYIIRLP